MYNQLSMIKVNGTAGIHNYILHLYNAFKLLQSTLRCIAYIKQMDFFLKSTDKAKRNNEINNFNFALYQHY